MPLATAAVEAISQTPFNPHKAVRTKRKEIGKTSVPKNETSSD